MQLSEIQHVKAQRLVVVWGATPAHHHHHHHHHHESRRQNPVLAPLSYNSIDASTCGRRIKSEDRIYVQAYTYKMICMCVYIIYIYICIYTCIYLHKHTQRDVHSYIHSYVHTYEVANLSVRIEGLQGRGLQYVQAGYLLGYR